MIGNQITHYLIQEKLGEGGMGIVYKAIDTRLQRTVAIKLLKPEVIDNPEAKERFIRETRAASALNHHNITTIYEIDEWRGRNFIVMEFVEGQTVKEKVKPGPLPMDEVLDIAAQTAEALKEAHKHDIIHRDIKSDNIMVTEKGQVKVMDFGLAKLKGMKTLTKAGSTIGTVAYMSPEQTKGKQVDYRTDIWSFGIVLYEMITGQLPFKSEYEQALIYSILNEKPEPIISLRPGVPFALDIIVTKALTKNPAMRYQQVDELKTDLHTIETVSIGKSRISRKLFAKASVFMLKRALFQWAITAFVTLVAAIAIGLIVLQPSSPVRLVSRSLMPPPENIIFNTNHGRHIAISPNGRTIAFVATDSTGVSKLWVRSLSALTSIPLNGTEGAYYPFWSSDSRSLGFFSAGKLKKIDTAGGLVLTICEAPNGRGGAWNKDNLILFAPNSTDALFTVSAAGGAPIQATTLDSARGENAHRWPSFLPDGKHFVFSVFSISPTGVADTIKLGIMDPSTSIVLLTAGMNTVYASGHLIYLQEGTLMARSFDAVRLKFTGEAVPIAENVQYSGRPTDKGNFSVSQNGVLVLQTGNTKFDRFALFDRMGNLLAVLPEQAVFRASFSPDDKFIAYPRFDAQSSYDIWIRDLSRGIASRLTFDPAIDYRPVWSPDGRTIAFSSNRKGMLDLFVKNIDGTGEEQLLLASNFNKFPSSWSRDGRYIAFTSDTQTKT